jgi:cyclopropane-fatty-acyl-phospholipid synthase
MRLAERLGLAVFRLLARKGRLELVLPDGTSASIAKGEPRADLTINDYRVVGEVLREGITGFAESYMRGDLDTSDLRRLLEWGSANQESWFAHPLSRATLPIRRFWQRVRPERRHRKVRSMGDHYNLGNEFYSAWLDETMTYSSARFASAHQSLADAQRNKYRTIADHAGIEPGMTVLEIGCGWGGFAEYAASQRDCDVVAVTLSEEQAAYARKRIAEAGLIDRVDIRLQDFRGIEGQFDAVVSIEMIESIDEPQWPALFDKISESLRPGALAAMQIITIIDQEWERYRSRTDFIQQYIFPGGQIPAPKVLRRMSSDAGLRVEQVETFGLDYARTLRAWQDSFEGSWPKLRDEHGLDERFRRMWNLYLMLCDAGFSIGRIDVQQWSFSRAVAG